MKNGYLILIFFTTAICDAQITDRFKPKDFNSLDWGNIELEISDSTLIDLISKSETLYGLYKSFGLGMKDFCHPVDLESDSKIDIIFYWQTSIQNQLMVFENTGAELNMIYERYIDLNSIESDLISSNVVFKGITYFQSVPPLAAGFYEITVDNKDKIKEKEYVYYGDTKFPTDYQIKQPFEIINDKYRLRTSPEIKDDNIICELATGDFGVALAFDKDDTGRIWWFVVVENNILKDVTYFHIDTDTKDIRLRRTMGWISSRYVIEK